MLCHRVSILENERIHIFLTFSLLLLLARLVAAAGRSGALTTVEPLRLFELQLSKLLRRRGYLRN